jgi:hypothetical protein
MLMFVVMFVVVIVIVAFVAVGFLGCSRWLIGFESVSGAQVVFAFRARQAPNLLPCGLSPMGNSVVWRGIYSKLMVRGFAEGVKRVHHRDF